MSRRPSVWLTALASVLAGVVTAAEVLQVQVQAPTRDPNQTQARRVPIGTGSVSGIVVAADTGRPLRGVRVTLNGTVIDGARAGGAAGAPTGTAMGPGLPGGLTGGTRGALPPGVVLPPGMQIQIGANMGISRTTLTSEQGEFTLARLPAGSYSVMASHNQFLASAYGQRRPLGPGRLVEVADGQKVQLTLPMVRGGVIAGTVFDERGEPQRGVQVRAWRYAYVNGVRRPQSTNGAQSDDRGGYRLFGLQPGDYVIGAAPNDFNVNDRSLEEAALIEQAVAAGSVQPATRPGGIAYALLPPNSPTINSGPQMSGFVSTFSPSATTPSGAAIIQIAGGDERAGVDVHLQPVRSGMVAVQLATPVPTGVSVSVWFTNNDPSLEGFSSSGSMGLGQNSTRFTLRNLAPGQYTVHAQAAANANSNVTVVNGVVTPPASRPTDADRLWGAATVSVSENTTTEVALVLQPGRSISGTLVLDMARPPDLSRNRPTVQLVPQALTQGGVQRPPQPAVVGPDGRFRFDGVLPGRYSFRTSIGQLRSAIAGGIDTLDFPLEFSAERDLSDVAITATDRVSDLSGVIADATGKPAADYTIVVAAADPRYWVPNSRRVATSRPGATGRFSFRSLPAGDYLLAAVTDLEQGQQFDPEFLRALSAASVRVQLSEGGTASQNLRVR